MKFAIRQATEKDISTVLSFIRELAEFERLAHEVEASEALLRESLFGRRPCAEVIFGCVDDEPVAFAVFFHDFSTFLGRQGLYLEDLYVKPAFRKQGIGKALLVHLAQIAKARNCGRFEWAVLNWNTRAIEFYESLGAAGLKEWTIYRVTGKGLDHLAAQAEAS